MVVLYNLFFDKADFDINKTGGKNIFHSMAEIMVNIPKVYLRKSENKDD